MSRGHYSAGKRAREAEKARKKREKAERRQRRREEAPAGFEVVSAEDVTGSLPTIEEAMRKLEPGATARTKGEGSPPCRLFVGGLSWDTTEDGLRKAFGAHGEVVDAFVVKDRDTGDSRGFGFVTMKNRRDASKAIEELNDSELDGRTIVVNVATERDR